MRATPTVCKVLKHSRRLLKMDDAGATRIVRSKREIIKWRALLRHRNYLSTTFPCVQKFFGERLNDSLQHLGEASDKKRELYGEMVLQGFPMESIRYESVKVLHTEESDVDDEIECYEFCLSSDDDKTSDEETE